MGTFEGLGTPLYGSFYHYNSSQTTVWTVADNGGIVLSYGDTGSSTVCPLEIDIDTTTVNAANQYGIKLKRSSTKAGTTQDSFLHMELGSTDAVVTSCFTVGTSSVLTRPSYFLSVASTAVSSNASGFVDEIMLTSRTTTSPMGALKCLVGTTSYYIPMFHATNTSTTAAH